MQDFTHHVVFNGSSGTALGAGLTAETLAERFAAAGHTADINADRDVPFAERMALARNSRAPILVAAGGDGTATALARIAIETGRPLAVLPLGTANLLARDLHLPLEIDPWFEAFSTMVARTIDVGEVNGEIFLHKVVIGAIPGIAAAREQIRGRSELSAKIGFIMHLARRLGSLRRFAVEVTPENGDPHIERVTSIAVANNDYDEGLGRFFSRSRLDQGRLSLYILRQLTLADALRLGLTMFMGNWRHDQVLEIENIHSVDIRTRRRQVRVMRDGEIEMLNSPLHFRIRPAALTILAPPPAEPAVETKAA